MSPKTDDPGHTVPNPTEQSIIRFGNGSTLKEKGKKGAFLTCIYLNCVFKVFLWKQKPSEDLNNETDWEGLDVMSPLAVHVSVSNPCALPRCLNGGHSNRDGNWKLILTNL